MQKVYIWELERLTESKTEPRPTLSTINEFDECDEEMPFDEN